MLLLVSCGGFELQLLGLLAVRFELQFNPLHQHLLSSFPTARSSTR